MILPSLSLLPPSLVSTASALTPPVPSLGSGLSPAGVCFPVCVEVPSETEAVQGNPMKLRCISCMKREDVEATTVVEWFYRPEGGKDFLVCLTADSALCFAGLCHCVPGSRQFWGMTSDKHRLFLSKALTVPLQITDSLSLAQPLGKGGLQASSGHSRLQAG